MYLFIHKYIYSVEITCNLVFILKKTDSSYIIFWKILTCILVKNKLLFCKYLYW